MNVVALSGNITRDLELRSTQSDKKVLTVGLAINEGKDKTEFIDCIAWEKSAELIAQYCNKGDRFTCTGRLQTRSYEQDGQKRYKTEVVIERFDFPPKSSGSTQPIDHQAPLDGGGSMEDEIPFARHMDFIHA